MNQNNSEGCSSSNWNTTSKHAPQVEMNDQYFMQNEIVGNDWTPDEKSQCSVKG